MKVEEIGITKIKPYWRNPRENTETVKALKKTIERHGFRQPILIDKNKVIISGHARYKAMREMGYKTVPCILVDDMDSEQARKFRITDNKIAELGRWDLDKLGEELKKLDDLSIMQDFGFNDFELDELVGLEPEPAEEAKREKNSLGGRGPENDENQIILTCPECYHEHNFTKKELLAKGAGQDS